MHRATRNCSGIIMLGLSIHINDQGNTVLELLNDGEFECKIEKPGPSLVEEGMAREIIHAINRARTKWSFKRTDRIEIYMEPSWTCVRVAMQRWGRYVMNETLADRLEISNAFATRPFDAEFTVKLKTYPEPVNDKNFEEFELKIKIGCWT